MEALKRIKANTVEKRLLNAKGNPNFNIRFFVLNKHGEYAGRGDVSRRRDEVRGVHRERRAGAGARAAAAGSAGGLRNGSLQREQHLARTALRAGRGPRLGMGFDRFLRGRTWHARRPMPGCCIGRAAPFPAEQDAHGGGAAGADQENDRQAARQASRDSRDAHSDPCRSLDGRILGVSRSSRVVKSDAASRTLLRVSNRSRRDGAGDVLLGGEARQRVADTRNDTPLQRRTQGVRHGFTRGPGG